ncbi:MAG: TlpA disulfide reductase family protein [Bacteroidota bacterium]
MKILAILFLGTALSFSPVSLEHGEPSPEITLPTANGEMLSLSSLQGDVVLIDFWASWCAPCRKKHPEMVNVYKDFKESTFKNGEGFQIYSISLDKSKERWLRAIQEDQLTWPHHVSDLKGWDSEAAKTFEIRSIPQNILLDRNGTIIGRNYSAEALKEVLTSLK